MAVLPLSVIILLAHRVVGKPCGLLLFCLSYIKRKKKKKSSAVFAKKFRFDMICNIPQNSG